MLGNHRSCVLSAQEVVGDAYACVDFAGPGCYAQEIVQAYE